MAQADPGLSTDEVSEESRVHVDNTDVSRASAEAMGIQTSVPPMN